MCEACFEMELYFAYLDDLEEKKKAEQAAAQPWQCEVTIMPQPDDAASPLPDDAAAAKSSACKPASRFVCEEPE
ncbi:MAG TPA: hypothetical protein VNL39_07715 [Xanthobacteraceae bacterium]|nr:hypothetical protein [Xanthobacteraceae bacterium]